MSLPTNKNTKGVALIEVLVYVPALLLALTFSVQLIYKVADLNYTKYLNHQYQRCLQVHLHSLCKREYQKLSQLLPSLDLKIPLQKKD